MRSKPIIYYEARIVFGMSALLPMLALPAYALATRLSWPYTPLTAAQLIQAFEQTLPLAMGLSTAHLMLVENEARFAELRNSYPEKSWRIPLLRTVGALIMLAPSLVIGIASFRALHGEFDIADVITPSIPPTLYVISLSLLISNLVRNYWLAAALVMGYWSIDYLNSGWLPHSVFLFDKSFPLPDVSYSTNRLLLVMVGAFFLMVNVWISTIRRRGFSWRGLVIGH